MGLLPVFYANTVLWLRGEAINEFDHMAVSKQGDAVEADEYSFNLDAKTLIKQSLERDTEDTSFSNLSFE